MDIKWLNAVIDMPADQVVAAGDFWCQVANTTRGEINAEYPEYVHLNPVSGNMVIELQRVDSGGPLVHLDLVVEDIPSAVDEAVAVGAVIVQHHPQGHAVLRTPGGVVFCIVAWGGESERPPPIGEAAPHAIDQICIDVPHEHFDADVAFWAQLTGWEPNPPQFPAFRSFAQPGTLPLRILLQQLGDNDTGEARAHLDISAGKHVAVVAERHAAAGATVVERFEHWTMMHDPSGMHYCITGRKPYGY